MVKNINYCEIIKSAIFHYPNFNPEILPNQVNKFVLLFGKPFQIELPLIDDLSPQGQWFFFRNKENSLMIKVLGDDYSQNPNYMASVRYFIIESFGAVIEIFPQITLYKTKKNEFEMYLSNSYSKIKKYFNSFNQIEHRIKTIYNESYFLYFGFVNNTFIKIELSSFDVDAAG